MKKIITISMLAVTLAATSAFGQGYLQLTSGRSQAWDGFTTVGVSAISSHINVALYWVAGANAANPMAVATTLANGNSQTTEATAGYTDAGAWTALLSSGWTLAQDSTAGNANVIVATSTRGAAIYSGGAGWAINGSAAGGTISLLEVGWNGAFATPGAAQTAGSAIGWSYLNSFVLATSALDGNILQANFTNFGVFVPAPVPEPTTIALAGLGSLSLLLFRRRK